MKYLLLFLLAFTAACSKKDAPPVAPAGPTATYTDATGKESTIATYRVAVLTTPPSASGQDRRLLSVRLTLADGTYLEVLYSYLGTGFPTTTGPVALDFPVYVANYPPTSSGFGYLSAAGATGSIGVDSVSPAVVSGSFVGALVVGGANIRVAFKRLPL